MATAAGVMAAIAAKLQTTLPFTPARMVSDLDSTLQPVPPGATRYQLKAFAGPVTEVEDSNQHYSAMAVELRVHYHLNPGEAEQTYTATSLQNTLEALLHPEFWRTITGVFLVAESLPEVALGDVVRIGNVVSFTLTLQLSIDPD